MCQLQMNNRAEQETLDTTTVIHHFLELVGRSWWADSDASTPGRANRRSKAVAFSAIRTGKKKVAGEDAATRPAVVE